MLINLFNYSGLATKIRAMEGKMLSQEDLIALTNLTTTKELIHDLINRPSYSHVFESIDESIHRGEIEKKFILAKYNDYMKIYNFSSAKQRQFLNIYFLRFEIDILKYVLRLIFANNSVNYDEFSILGSFFDKHSHINLERLIASKSIKEFIDNLKGTELYTVLSKIESNNSSIFDYEMQLELYYYIKIWKVKDKYLSKRDNKIITKILGTQIDMLNIMWIYRVKKYFHLDQSLIYAYIIPIRYKLSKQLIESLVKSNNLIEFQKILVEQSSYSKIFTKLDDEKIEVLYYKSMIKLFESSKTNNPLSISTVVNYLFRKEIEIQNITSILEGVRYNLDNKSIQDYLY